MTNTDDVSLPAVNKHVKKVQDYRELAKEATIWNFQVVHFGFSIFNIAAERQYNTSSKPAAA